MNILLRKQFPAQNGLQDTLELSKKLQWRSSSTDFVQIIHVSQNHWVCVSNCLTPPGVVEVYDSLPATFNATLLKQIAAIVRCEGEKFSVRIVDVQHQSGRDDCALFAIAFAYALCTGKDPHLLSLNQKQMRPHLQLCLERGVISMFPEDEPRSKHVSRMKMSRNVFVYCSCRLLWDKSDKMVQCSNCREWFHQSCLNIPNTVFVDPTYIWSCDQCEA